MSGARFNMGTTGEFSPHLKLSMLSFLIVLYVVIGVQGKAFPSRYKRNYEGGYHYIPYGEGIVQIPAGYAPENLPDYQDYIRGYVQANGIDWPRYYQPMLPQQMTHPHSIINGHHKMKTGHNWHFKDPASQKSGETQVFESDVEAPNVVEALVKKDVIDEHGENDAPVVVEALIRKDHMDQEDVDDLVVVDPLNVKEKPTYQKYDKLLVTKPSSSHLMYEPIKQKPIAGVAFISSNELEPPMVDSLQKNKPVKIKPAASYGALKLPVIDSLTKKDKPAKIETIASYETLEKPFLDSLTKDKPKMEPVASNSQFELPVVADSLTKKNKPIKVKPVASYDEFELSVVDSLTMKDKPVKEKPVSYDEMEIPAVVASLTKDKPVKMEPVSYGHFELRGVDSLTKDKPVASYDDFELPVIVDSLSQKDKPVILKPVASYGEFELPVVDSLTKDKPVKVEPIAYDNLELRVMDSLTKKDKPVKMEPVASYSQFELPVVVNSLTKKDKPVKVEPVNYDFELPVVVDALTKNDKTIKVEPETFYRASEFPVSEDYHSEKVKPIMGEPHASYGTFQQQGVDSLTKKDNPVKDKPVYSYNIYEPIKEKPIKEKPIKEKPIKEKPIKEKPIKEKPIKEKPIKEKPIKEKPISEFESLNKAEELDHETPVVIEALIRKETPAFHTEEENESPIIVEALVQKHPHENENKISNEGKIPQKDMLHSTEPLLTKEDVESFAIPVVEALTFEDTESNESPHREDATFEEMDGFNEPEIDDFNEPKMDDFIENAENGSAMDFDRSRFARSFLMTNNQEQERRKFKNCVTPKNETGKCMPFQQCSVSSTVTNIDELLRNVCIIDEVFIGVCCPEFPVETVRVDWELLKPDAEKLNEDKTEVSRECGKLPLRVTNQDPWPWMVSLIAKSSDKIFCGGALITEQYALTAAHCTVRIPRNQILVRLGRPASENGPEEDFEVVEIKRHAGYNPRTMQNDLALLKLSRGVKLGDFRRVVCFAKDEEDSEDLVSQTASLLRWKGTPGEIKDVEPLKVISTQECQTRMRTTIADSILCTEPRTDETMCNADSGAPLIIAKDDRFEVIGILTWNRNDCDERFPAVFTRVSSYQKWIEKLAS